MFHRTHSHHKIAIIIGCVLGFLGFVGVAAYTLVQQITPETLLSNSFVQEEIKKRVGAVNADIVDLLPSLAGFAEPRTALLLFLNNTEIRPGGGFIGSYAVVRIDRGHIELITLEGSEQLDKRSPVEWKPTPPAPIVDHLGVSTWFFRDANWDPDFVTNAERMLEFYTEEGGVAADTIDLLVAIDTEVLESVLEVLGPIEVQGKTFTAANVVELLQYDTSYGFEDRAIPFEDRKQILDALFAEIQNRLPRSLIQDYPRYVALGNQLIQEKHVQLYSTDTEEQRVFEDRGIAGRVDQVDHDYLMWVDANLAALKTDRVIDRDLSYRLVRRADGKVEATVSMTYRHTGTFDWRTSRYRTYARIFVPAGSTLVSTSGDMRTDRSTDRGRVDQGEQFGKQWFGTFISIEPGHTGTLSFTYVLPDAVVVRPYQLLVETQPGVGPIDMTLRLEFDQPLSSATPAEVQTEWGDAAYVYNGTLRTDQVFMIE